VRDRLTEDVTDARFAEMHGLEAGDHPAIIAAMEKAAGGRRPKANSQAR
jgi:hypothetical protein